MAVRTTQGIRVRLLVLLLVASVIPYAVGTRLERAGEQPRPSEQTVSAPATEQPHSEQAEGQPQELAHTGTRNRKLLRLEAKRSSGSIPRPRNFAWQSLWPLFC